MCAIIVIYAVSIYIEKCLIENWGGERKRERGRESEREREREKKRKSDRLFFLEVCFICDHFFMSLCL